MDCISCDKCRLNGKVQVRGLATILKVLFLPESMRHEVMKTFSNQEIVSSIVLLTKLSESLLILEKNRAEESTKETMAWFYKQVCCFFASATIIMSSLFLLGYRSRHADGWAKANVQD